MITLNLALGVKFSVYKTGVELAQIVWVCVYV